MENLECKNHPGVKLWLQIINTHQKILNRISDNLAQYNLTLPQLDTLATLKKHNGISQQDLAQRLLVTKGNICGLVDRLSEKGLVERKGCPGDRRINNIYITEIGEKLIADVLPGHHLMLEKLLNVLDKDQQLELSKLLENFEKE